MARVWILKRNCSITPRQLALVYAMLSAVSLTIATGFAFGGAWYVLVFSVLELAAVGAALVIYARHATDQECIRLEGGVLHVCLAVGGSGDGGQHITMNLQQTRVVSRGSRRGLVRLQAAGTQVEVGRFLTEWKRRELADDITNALNQALNQALNETLSAKLAGDQRSESPEAGMVPRTRHSVL